MVGYTGDDPGIVFTVPAGSVVAITSDNFHRSGANISPNMCRVYLPQCSAEPINSSEENKLWGMAVPFVKDGQIVYDAAEKYGGQPGLG